MSRLAVYVCIYVSSVFVASISQVMLKTSAEKEYKNRLFEYLNPLVVIAYGLFFISTFLTVYALKVVPLSLGNLLESSGYIFVPLLSFLVLKEKMTKNMWIGSAFIIAGILVYSL